MKHLSLTTKVKFKIRGKIDNVHVESEQIGFIASIRLGSNAESVYPIYGITLDLCSPYHYGSDVKWLLKRDEFEVAND